MKYTKGSIKRVFVVKFEHGDDLLAELTALIRKEEIKSGIIHMIGALEKSDIVVGPKKVEVPPSPVWRRFDDGREIIGFGTIFWKDDEPKIHIHAGIAREDKVNVGCVRKNAFVYLVVEAVIIEIDANISRKFDDKTGLDLLAFN